MVEATLQTQASPVDLKRGMTMTSAAGLWTYGGGIALAGIGLLLLVFYTFGQAGNAGPDGGKVVGAGIFMLILVASLILFGGAAILVGFALRGGNAATAAARWIMAYGIMQVALAALLIYASSVSGTSDIIAPAILFLIAGGLLIAASVVGLPAIANQRFIGAGLGMGGALMALIAGQIVRSQAGGVTTGFQGDAATSLLVAGIVEPLVLMLVGVGVILHAALNRSPARATAFLAVGVGAVILGLTYFIQMIDMLGDNPFGVLEFITDGLLKTGLTITVIGLIIVGIAGLVAIAAAVLVFVHYGKELAAMAPKQAAWTDVTPTAAPSAAAKGPVLCPRCHSPNPRGARFCNSCGFAPGGAA